MSISGAKDGSSDARAFGIRLAKTLVLHARSEAPKYGLTSQEVINEAADYLHGYTRAARDSLIDEKETGPEERKN
jgi:hypothetical protein